MRVALLSPRYWPEERRGTERFVRTLADGLLARGVQPRLITSHPGRPSRRTESGLVVWRVWRAPEDRLRRRGFGPHLTHLPAAWLALCAGRDDLVHALYPTDGLLAARWRARTGGPAVLSLMGLPDRASLVGARGRAEGVRRAARGCSVAVSLSEAAAAAHRRLLGIETRVIPPGVRLEEFTPGGERAPAPVLLCPASLAEARKRGALLLAGFARLRRRVPEAELWLSSRHGRQALPQPGVRVLDLDRTEALRDAYRRAWATVLVSREEAFGLVLAESLACGTPVLGARSGALPEIVDREGIGVLLDGEDADELAEAMQAALALGQAPESARACRARAGQLSAERTTEAYLSLYEELLGAA